MKELPLETEGATTESEVAAGAEITAEATPAEDAIVGSNPQKHQQILQPDTWLTGEVNSLPTLGTAQVPVWDIKHHGEANAEAVKE